MSAGAGRSLAAWNSGPGVVWAHGHGFKLGLEGEGGDKEPAQNEAWDDIAKLEGQGASR